MSIFNDISMWIRFKLIGLLNIIVLFLLPENVSSHIRTAMKGGSLTKDLEALFFGTRQGGESISMGTTLLGLTDLSDGTVALELVFDPAKGLEALIKDGKTVHCTAGENLAQSITRLLIASFGADNISTVTLPGLGKKILSKYKGYVVVGDLTEERKREIDEQLKAGESPEMIVTGGPETSKKRMH